MRLRHVAERTRLSQSEIAKRLGVSLSKVGNWFQGKNFPKRDAKPLAALLGVPVEFLLYGAVPVEEVGPPEQILEEQGPGYQIIRKHEHSPAADELTEVREQMESLIRAAGGNRDRLGWLRTELLRMQATVQSWTEHDDLNLRALEKARRISEAAKHHRSLLHDDAGTGGESKLNAS